jgi:hypothetical protein
VESTFSMVKRKFGDSIRNKTDVAMVNEVLCKLVCHNIVCLIHEMYELGIEPNFWAESATAQKFAENQSLLGILRQSARLDRNCAK